MTYQRKATETDRITKKVKESVGPDTLKYLKWFLLTKKCRSGVTNNLIYPCSPITVHRNSFTNLEIRF